MRDMYAQSVERHAAGQVVCSQPGDNVICLLGFPPLPTSYILYDRTCLLQNQSGWYYLIKHASAEDVTCVRFSFLLPHIKPLKVSYSVLIELAHTLSVFINATRARLQETSNKSCWFQRSV